MAEARPLPGDCSLRAAREGDAGALSALVDEAYRGYVERLGRLPKPMTEDYAEVIGDRDVTVVESEGEIVAAIVLGPTEEGFTIDNIAVRPSRQGEGIGHALLALAAEEARRAGFDAVHLYVHEKLTENLALYERVGYVEYDRRPVEDFHRVYMRKRLA